MTPLRDLGVCPACSTPDRPVRLVQQGPVVRCPGCGAAAGVAPGVVETRPGESEREFFERVVDTVVAGGRVVRCAEQPSVVVGNALLDLNPQTAATLQFAATVLEGRNERYLRRGEALQVATRLIAEPERLPAVALAVVRSVLYRNAAGDLVPTRRGTNACAPGAEGVLQLGEDVEPGANGTWGEFLDMTPFAGPEDRRTFDAWAMTALLPLEVPQYPLLVVAGTGNGVGKSYLLQTVASALGQNFAGGIKLDPVDAALRRDLVAAARVSRMVVLDNATGSAAGRVDSEMLATMLTSDTLNTKALFRVGEDRVRNAALWCLTMNEGRLGSDLVTRAVGVRLRDPSEDEQARRELLGDRFWRTPGQSRRVLADLMARTIAAWRARPARPVPADRFADWHALAARHIDGPALGVPRDQDHHAQARQALEPPLPGTAADLCARAAGRRGLEALASGPNGAAWRRLARAARRSGLVRTRHTRDGVLYERSEQND